MIAPAIILTHPSALLWALAVGAVVALYLRPIRPPRAVVVRPHLWQKVLGEPRSAPAPWRRRRIVSATVMASIVVLLALAAADPCWNRPRTVVFVVDTSNTPETTDSTADWLTETKTAIQKHLDAVGPREYAALISTAGQPLVFCPAEQNKERVRAMLERLRTANLPSQIDAALKLAEHQAAPGTHLQIHVFAEGSAAPETAGYVVGPLVPWLALAAIVLLAGEWAFYHRRYTC